MKMSQQRQIGYSAKAKSRYGVDKRCVWCNILTRKVGLVARPTDSTREHMIPRSAGGGGGRNLGNACRRCNNNRRSDKWVPWRAVSRATTGYAYRWHEGTLQRRPMHVLGREYTDGWEKHE